MNHQFIDTDLVVVGGGLAGVCAAISAARNGIRVVLLQDRSVLGGNASSEVRMHIVGADCHGTRPGAREAGLIEEFKLEDAARNPQRSFAQWDLLLYEKVMAEPRIQLMLDTDCVGCELQTGPDGRRSITAAKAVCNATESAYTIRARYFADCSGDGRLGVEAGADFVLGREAQHAFGESLAPVSGDSQTLGASIMFTAKRHDSPQPFVSPSWVRPFKRDEFKFRPIKSYEYGYWWAEWGGHLDVIRDMPAIRHELLRIAYGIWDYIKNSGDYPDSANWVLDWIGAIPGKRESRRFLGPVMLTQHDVEDGRLFEDQVAYGGWWLDLHPPTGIDAVEEEPCDQVHFPHLYSIPLRALYSRNVGNLFFAGRNISASHVAFASTRVMATCATMGQAIGTAAALAADKDGALQEIFAPALVEKLQQVLMKDDAFLPSLRNRDRADLALKATATASDAAPGGAPENVLDGIARELPRHLGPWADGASHRWESLSLPAWLELNWSGPVEIAEIHLTFDSGFQRELILSPSDQTTRKVIRGPQPELVCDYDLCIGDRTVLEVRGNFLRKRVHRLDTPLKTSSLRLKVLRTQGIPSARLFEFRAYSP